VRPERLGAATTAADRRLRGTVLLCEALGSDSLAYVAVEGASALSDAQSALANDVEDAVEAEELAGDETRAANVVARLDPRVQIGVGETLELEVYPGALYFFDPETGEALD
jgi:ABC-type sugar transport system ATPase subunit